MKRILSVTLFLVLAGCEKKNTEYDFGVPIHISYTGKEIVTALIDGHISSINRGYDLELKGVQGSNKFLIVYHGIGDITVTTPAHVKAGDKLGTVFPWQNSVFAVSITKNGKIIPPPSQFPFPLKPIL